MAMPEAPEGYEWEVSLPSLPHSVVYAHLRLKPTGAVLGEDYIYYAPVYGDGLGAVEEAARGLLADREAADRRQAEREAVANEWAEALGCKVVP